MRLCFSMMAALLIGAAAAHAQDWPRFEANIGAQVADFHTDVELDASEAVLGTPVDFEGDVGLNENAGTAWAAALWRLSRRNHFEIAWTRADRTVVQHRLASDIRFGEETLEAGTEVDAFLDSWFIGASYRFAVVTTPVVELGPLVGLVVVNLSTGMDFSRAGSDDNVSQDATVTAPAVLPGAFIGLRAHPRLTIRARSGYVSADFGRIDGHILVAQAGADVRISRWFGVGGNYSYNRMSIAVDDDDFNGRLTYTFSGPQVYAVFAF